MRAVKAESCQFTTVIYFGHWETSARKKFIFIIVPSIQNSMRELSSVAKKYENYGNTCSKKASTIHILYFWNEILKINKKYFLNILLKKYFTYSPLLCMYITRNIIHVDS